MTPEKSLTKELEDTLRENDKLAEALLWERESHRRSCRHYEDKVTDLTKRLAEQNSLALEANANLGSAEARIRDHERVIAAELDLK